MPESVVLKKPSVYENKLGQATLVKIDTYTIPANSNKIYQFVGDNLFIYSSTGAVGALTFSFDDQAAQGLLTGQVISSPSNFKTVQISNTTGSPITYTVVIANGTIDFKGLVISATITVQSVQAASGTFGARVAAGVAQKVFTAGTVCQQIYLQADPNNGNPIYFGFDNSVTASKYVFALSPGQIYPMGSYDGDLYMFGTAGDFGAISYA